MTREPLVMKPIGVAHTQYADKQQAPRQAVANGSHGTLELFVASGIEDALCGIEEWQRIWVLFGFDRASGFRPKVQPPRSAHKIGVLATRSPHRPNPIGLSCVKLLAVRGLILDVEDIDLLDQTPIYDIKPYVPYADAFADAGSGWLEPARDPQPDYTIEFSPLAQTQLAWLDAAGEPLVAGVTQALALGPAPHAYRRITPGPAGVSRLAHREWRVYFRSAKLPRTLHVLHVESGFRPQQIAEATAPKLHCTYSSAFGMPRGLSS
jgi:tRNA (adenine37-N6)-methyltransferase